MQQQQQQQAAGIHFDKMEQLHQQKLNYIQSFGEPTKNIYLWVNAMQFDQRQHKIDTQQYVDIDIDYHRNICSCTYSV